MTIPPSVAKFRKLGGEVSLTEKIYHPPKNRNYIRQTLLSLSNHWASNNSISCKAIYAKAEKNDIALFLFKMFMRSFGPE